MTDPRIDKLASSAILTNTQFRMSFAPRNPEARITALKFEARADKIAQMQNLMQLGTIHIQIKAGFGEERSIELSGPEAMLLFDGLDKFITELPRAQAAKPLDE